MRRLLAYWQRLKPTPEDRRALAIYEKREAQRERHERDIYANNQKIVASLDRIGDQNDASQQEQRAQNNRSESWDRCRYWLEVAGVVVAFLAAYLLWGTLDEAKHSTVEANRAWIAPTGVWHDNRVAYVVGEPIFYSIIFKNVGRTPALNLKWNIENGIFPTANRTLDVSKSEFSRDNMCADMADAIEVGAVWPDPSRPVYTIDAEGFTPPVLPVRSDQPRRGKPVKITQAMLDGNEALYVRGCVAYSTMTISAKTSFCFFVGLVRGPEGMPGKSTSAACRNGNEAD